MNLSRLNSFKVALPVYFLMISGHARAMGTLSDFKNLWSGKYQSVSESSVNFQRIITDPTVGPSYISMSSGTPISLKRKHFRLKIRINDFQSWQGLELRALSDKDNGFENYYAISVSKFTDPEFNVLQSQQWSELTLSLGEARIHGSPQLDKIYHIGLYVSGNKEAALPFTVDLQSFDIVPSVPMAIVSMTFDDGYDEQFEAAQIMAQYGLRGTAYVMTNEIDQKGYLKKEQLIEMHQQMGWSISSHHVTPITQMSSAELEQEVEKTFEFLSELGIPTAPDHFAYPLGKQSISMTLPYIRSHFSTARVAGGGAETLPPSDWHMLRAYNVTPDITPAMLEQRIQKAIAHNEWLILMFHRFTEGTPENDLNLNFSVFEEFCKVIKNSSVSVHPVNEVYEAFQ